ncbi:hypothetical protein GCM10010260_59380 [Streptomyces filipinensis]|uniref:Uncharacterized protein n=1 Tax=Streptomyces filipinensis TaxID=66887 RepID=A0A918IFZ9_9ACTN|nr:hypothetical protein GCM10010260_59380 [Streptomyces filipinensis]
MRSQQWTAPRDDFDIQGRGPLRRPSRESRSPGRAPLRAPWPSAMAIRATPVKGALARRGDSRLPSKSLTRRLNLDRKTVRRFRDTGLDQLLRRGTRPCPTL